MTKALDIEIYPSRLATEYQKGTEHLVRIERALEHRELPTSRSNSTSHVAYPFGATITDQEAERLASALELSFGDGWALNITFPGRRSPSPPGSPSPAAPHPLLRFITPEDFPDLHGALKANSGIGSDLERLVGLAVIASGLRAVK